MNSKSNKVTWQTMSNEPSLSSIESGFVSLTGSKAKETVNGRNDLNMEKNKDIKIFVENARNAMKDAQKEKKSNFQKFVSCLSNCFASINKNCLNSILHGILAFLITTACILFFLLIFTVFWIILKNIYNYPFFAKDDTPFLRNFWIIVAQLLMFIFLGVIYLLITILHKIVISAKISPKIKEFVTLIYTKFSFCCSIIYFLLLFIFTLIFFYLYLEDIISTCTEYRFVWAIFTLFMFVVILIGYFLHLRSACFV